MIAPAGPSGVVRPGARPGVRATDRPQGDLAHGGATMVPRPREYIAAGMTRRGQQPLRRQSSASPASLRTATHRPGAYTGCRSPVRLPVFSTGLPDRGGVECLRVAYRARLQASDKTAQVHGETRLVMSFCQNPGCVCLAPPWRVGEPAPLLAAPYPSFLEAGATPASNDFMAPPTAAGAAGATQAGSGGSGRGVPSRGQGRD